MYYYYIIVCTATKLYMYNIIITRWSRIIISCRAAPDNGTTIGDCAAVVNIISFAIIITNKNNYFLTGQKKILLNNLTHLNQLIRHFYLRKCHHFI